MERMELVGKVTDIVVDKMTKELWPLCNACSSITGIAPNTCLKIMIVAITELTVQGRLIIKEEE